MASSTVEVVGVLDPTGLLDRIVSDGRWGFPASDRDVDVGARPATDFRRVQIPVEGEAAKCREFRRDGLARITMLAPALGIQAD